MSDSRNEKKRHPIDQDFLEIMHKIKDLAQKLTVQESNAVKMWIGKLTGTNPIKRNKYIRCLLEQVESGKLKMPFTDIPDHFAELPPLHEALHGPIPDLNAPKTTTWRSGRGKLDPKKQMTQKELKIKHGTDRIGLHTCLRDVKDFDDLSVQGLIALTGPHTKDGGAALLEIMQEELQEFRTDVKLFYEDHSTLMAEQVGKEQIEMKGIFKTEVAKLTKKERDLELLLKNKNPNFDWNWFRNYNKIDADQCKKLKRLRQQAIKEEEKNKKIKELIAEMEGNLSRSH